MPTITDVAERAGVSVKTVSRVMNGYTHISEKTRLKVQTAIDELAYVPSAVARQMRLGDSLSIGMLYGDPSSGYQAQLNHSMLKACSDAGRYLAVELFDERSTEWRGQVAEFLNRTRVRNMVLVPPMCDSIEVHDLLRERDVRFVLVSPSRQIQDASSVGMDDRLAGFEVTQHLIDLGHRQIGHIAGHEEHVVTLLRRLGFEDAMSRAGLDVKRNALVSAGRFRFKQALDCAEEMLSRPNRPTAIFAANDQMAVAVMMMAHRMGLSIPEDLSVAGFDNTAMSQEIWPALTTVAQPFDGIARAAVELLDARSTEKTAFSRAHVLPHRLIIRQSTGPAPKPH